MDKIIARKFKFAIDSIEDLKYYYEKYSKLKDEKELKGNFIILKRVSEEIIETTIKINIIVLKSKLRFPVSYKNSFTDMKEFYDFDKKFLEDISNTVIFRNELAHEYVDMSQEYAIDKIKELFKLYPKYLSLLHDFLKSDKF